MHPYREFSSRGEHTMLSHTEERIVYALLVVVGLIPVATALAQGTVFGVEATIGLLMVLAGVIGAVSDALRARDHGPS